MIEVRGQQVNKKEIELDLVSITSEVIGACEGILAEGKVNCGVKYLETRSFGV
jgi:hypothetical protein